jgi:hypothetical protein
MTLEEFNNLSNFDQYDIIYNDGIFMDTIIDGHDRYVLYAIDNFFVELYYQSFPTKVVGKRVFVTGKLLDKYTVDLLK